MGDRADETNFSNIKYTLYEKFVRWLKYLIDCRNAKQSCLDLIKRTNPKRILVMNCSSFRPDMFKQRSHHFAQFFSKHFDLVIYKSLAQITVKKWENNIWLSKWLPDIKFKDADVYYYTTSVNTYPYRKLLKNTKNGYKLIYDYMDEMTEMLALNDDIKKIWKNLRKLKPVLCIASSDKLFKELNEHLPGGHNILVKNGVTVEDFSREYGQDDLPGDIKAVVDEGKPIVGYYGHIGPWIDLELLNKAAKARPQYNFVYIGATFGNENKKLLNGDNVHYLGRKDYSVLPAYGKTFTCSIIPFICADIAKATSPVKLFEYMAMKKPVVCTRDLLECYGYEGVLIARDDEDFINKLDEAMKLACDENIKNKLYEAACSESWGVKAKKILHEIGIEE